MMMRRTRLLEKCHIIVEIGNNFVEVIPSSTITRDGKGPWDVRSSLSSHCMWSLVTGIGLSHH